MTREEAVLAIHDAVMKMITNIHDFSADDIIDVSGSETLVQISTKRIVYL